jgi:exodeoxyribonuclease V alpha subunit
MSFSLPALGRPVGHGPGDASAFDLAAGFGSVLAQLHQTKGGDPRSAMLVARLGALLSHWTSQGHSCLSLKQIGRALLTSDASEEPDGRVLGQAELLAAISSSPAIGRPSEQSLKAPEHLVIEDLGRLYLQRYWRYEVMLAKRLAAFDRLRPVADEAQLRATLKSLFPADANAEVNWQMLAAANALLRQLSVITGGPGTGKTHTVARLLAAILRVAPASRIALAAPTGKAALRLEQLLQVQLASLDDGSRLPAAAPERTDRRLTSLKATTVHRLLGGRPGSSRLRYHQGTPLPFDVVIVDEASMLDLSLANKLMDALPDEARLVLLGDADQLASVETGAVFAELAALEGRSSESAAVLARVCDLPLVPTSDAMQSASRPLGDAVVRLRKSFRYQDSGDIGRLADAVREANVAGVAELLSNPALADQRHLIGPEMTAEALGAKLLPHFSALLQALRQARPPSEVLATLSRYTVLCGLRRGPLGALRMNQVLARLVALELHQERPGVWFAGRVVMVTSNDPMLGLYNGDVGIALPTGEGLMVHFASQDTLRSVAPARLANCETAFALTVHKSQGSEFDAVDVVLPPSGSPLNCRELLYTAVTRARSRVGLWSDATALEEAVLNSTQRDSALGERIARHAINREDVPKASPEKS